MAFGSGCYSWSMARPTAMPRAGCTHTAGQFDAGADKGRRAGAARRQSAAAWFRAIGARPRATRRRGSPPVCRRWPLRAVGSSGVAIAPAASVASPAPVSAPSSLCAHRAAAARPQQPRGTQPNPAHREPSGACALHSWAAPRQLLKNVVSLIWKQAMSISF